MIEQIAFIIIAGVAFALAYRSFSRIYKNIRLGKSEAINDRKGERWKRVLLIAFGQKKMFKNPLVAVLHLFIYVAFLATQVELIEIIADGLFGVHRIFAPYLGILYTVAINIIEFLSVLALVATVVFLYRRNLLRIPRFVKSELDGWPRLDANLILIFEIILIFGIMTMNGADAMLQGLNPAYYPDTGTLLISSWVGPNIIMPVLAALQPVLSGVAGMWSASVPEGADAYTYGSLAFTERLGWWVHLLMVLVFLNYLAVSKHLHIALAFPNTYFSKLDPQGKMKNMPEVEKEVRAMMDPEGAGADSGEEIPEFGAGDVTGLSWKNILDAYSCTECGRCTAACPASITGKKLSPRKVMMDVRDRAEEVGRKINSGNKEFIREEAQQRAIHQESTSGHESADKVIPLNKENFYDGKSLFDYITPEELHACTTCNACVEACPVMIDPLDIILQMRRHEILTQSAGPQNWVPMFTALENGGSPWQMTTEREAWRNEDA